MTPGAELAVQADGYNRLLSFAFETHLAHRCRMTIGGVHYGVSDQESNSRVFRRSLFAVQDIQAGERFTTENVQSIRPGHGLHTRYLEEILGRCAATDIQRGTPLKWDLIGGAFKGKP